MPAVIRSSAFPARAPDGRTPDSREDAKDGGVGTLEVGFNHERTRIDAVVRYPEICAAKPVVWAAGILMWCLTQEIIQVYPGVCRN